MKSITLLVTQLLLLPLIIGNVALANEVTTPKAKPNSEQKSPQRVTIESKIRGSQEQPKVLYIMPWQGMTNSITIEEREMQLSLTRFKPINPKTFKKEVRDFAAIQAEQAKKAANNKQ